MSEHRKSVDSVSHGRGGAGNIGADSTPYADGEIVREGYAGDHGDGAYSAGRGGAGNVGSPRITPTARKDTEAIPETALRHSIESDHHVGRGGAGNEEHKGTAAPQEGSTLHVGLADKLKNKLFKKKAEAHQTTATTT